MRLEVAAWKSGFLWRRTDDDRLRTPWGEAYDPLRLFFAGTMYCGSALTKPVHTWPMKQVPARLCAATKGSWSRRWYRRDP